MESSVSGVGVLDKSISVLNALEAGPSSLSDLVERTGLSRATTHRLAVALEMHGLVRRDDQGRFMLGVRLISLGRVAVDAMPLAISARPALADLRDTTGESVQLYVREGDKRICIVSMESPHGLRTIVPLGASLPLGVGSAGRVLTEGSDSSGGHGGGHVEGVGEGRTRQDARDTRVWVQSVAEREAGVASVSAPVRDERCSVVAAVSVSGPIERTTRQPGKRYGEDVLLAAARIEKDAGFCDG